MGKYIRWRIVFSEQRQKFKLQARLLWVFWITLDDEFNSLEDAEHSLSLRVASDWKPVE